MELRKIGARGARRGACLASALALTIAIAAPARAQGPTRSFDIPRQSLSEALTEFSRQSDIVIAAPTSLTRGRMSKPVSGTMPPADALREMLGDTGLGVVEKENGILTIRKDASLGESGANGDRVASLGESSPVAGEAIAESPSNYDEGTEIVVTGTNIRGTKPTGAPLSVYTKEDIDRTGAVRLDQFARTVTENFSDTDTIAGSSSFRGAQIGAARNAYAGAAFNLRGLGAASTLTLLNSRRIAPGGNDGSFADISQVPISVVERIEILSDGASAIYGADAVSGVVNIITRRRWDGAETSVRYNTSTRGGAEELAGSQTIGKTWASGDVIANYEYNKQFGLDARQRNYIPNQGGPSSLIPRSTRHSGFVSATQRLGESTTLDATAILSSRRSLIQSSTNAGLFSTRGKSVIETDQYGFSAGLRQRLRGDWEGRFTGSYSTARQFADSSTEFSELGFTSLSVDRARTQFYSVDGIANGSLFNAFGGPIKGAIGGGYRREEFTQSTEFSSVFGGVTLPPSAVGIPTASREVLSAFAEFLVPILSPGGGSGWRERLDFSAAVRLDKYSDFGTTVNPKFGFTFEPVQSLTLRGTYGTSFRAPLLSQARASPSYTTSLVPDATHPAGEAVALSLSGGNEYLGPEKSKSYSLGFDFRPVSSLRISGTYFAIDIRGRISTPPSSAGGIYSLSDPLLSPFIQRSPSALVVEAYLNSPFFVGDFTGIPGGVGPADVLAILDVRPANIAQSMQRGADASIFHDMQVGTGSLTLSASSQFLFKNKIKVVRGAPAVNLLNTFGWPTRFRGRGSATYVNGPLLIGASASYVNAYNNPLFTPPQRISSWTVLDLQLGYSSQQTSGIGRGISFMILVNNVTDKRPPRLNIPANLTAVVGDPVPYDNSNSSPTGRMVSLQLKKAW